MTIEQRPLIAFSLGAFHLAQGWTPEVCDTCSPQHVENCPLCFGWGMAGHDYGTPISGSMIEAVRASGEWAECELCHGSPGE